MVGPSSQISKLLLTLLMLVLLFYIYMDYNLYDRIQNYALTNDSAGAYPTWFGCDYSPLCVVTVKALLLDQTNLYAFAPLVHISDKILKISETLWITPNSISVFHVFVAIVAAKCVTSSNLAYRRVGVVLFELRTFLDDLDGHVARVRKHVRGERSEIGSSGYYVDGLCDALGCTALMIGVFVFLKSNPPRRGYMQLPTNSGESKDNIVYKAKVTTTKVARKVCFFSTQLIISSTAWNRYIALYQDMLERNNVSQVEAVKQNTVFKSSFFFMVTLLWRIVNVHNMLHFLLLAIFCDKLWEFLKSIEYIGFGILLSVICVTEMHVIDAKKFIYIYYNKLNDGGTI